jgi:hypothetical protein
MHDWLSLARHVRQTIGDVNSAAIFAVKVFLDGAVGIIGKLAADLAIFFLRDRKIATVSTSTPSFE